MEMNGWEQNDYVNTASAAYHGTQGRTEKGSGIKGGEASAESGLYEVSGRTIGNPKLSDKALKYYEQLKRKYGNMDFILVSPEMKQEAERKKGMYQSGKELLVLIDSDKIERMAQDEEYRKKYEGILNSATARMSQMKRSLGSGAKQVRSYGMTFDDHGNASFFAVVDKMLVNQRERIADRHEKNVRNKKEAEKKLKEKKAEEKRAEEKNADRSDAGEQVTVTASSWGELLEKVDAVIKDASLYGLWDRALTEEEKKVGQSIDYSL